MSIQTTWRTQHSTNEDIVMQDDLAPIPWHPLLKAGRQLSSWFFSNPPRALPLPHAMCPPEQYADSSPDYSPEGPAPMELDDAPSPTSQLHINALPVELLCEIFALYTHTFNDGNPVAPDEDTRTRRRRKRDTPRRFGRVITHKNSATNPILLGHVCGYWRALSLSMPTLWSKIDVSFPTVHDTSLFAMWLERSGTLPLDLTIVHSAGRVIDDGIQDILQLALKEHRRWKHVNLHLNRGTDQHFQRLASPLSFPILESFDIFLGDWNGDVAATFCQCLHSGPRLRKIRHKNWWTEPSCLETIPWGNLDSVEMELIALQQLQEALQAGEHLRRLVLHHVSDSPAVTQRPTRIALPRLESLSIGKVEDVSHFMEMLELPMLREFQLMRGFGQIRRPEEAWPEVEGHLVKYGCRLNSLLLDLGPATDDDMVVDVLHSPFMTDISHLTIRSKVTSKVAQALTHSPILPRLKELVLSKLYSDDHELTNMIRSRAGTLQSLEANIYSADHFKDLSKDFPGIRLTLRRL